MIMKKAEGEELEACLKQASIKIMEIGR